MLCPTCTKLAFQYTKKLCLRCQAPVTKSICALCELCSNSDKQCSACLKKLQNSSVKKHYYGGCGNCRK